MMADAGLPAGSRAVLIGVSDYAYPGYPAIKAARNSLEAMRSALADPALCRWPPGLITMIANPASGADLAVRIAELAERTTGVLLLYYVGHGVLSPRAELCLTVPSTHPDWPKPTSLTWETLAELLRTCPARTRLVILDCCFAGRAIEALGADGGQGLADITQVDGVYTLTATTRNGTAHVPPPSQQGTACTSFTGELLELIRSGIHGGPAWLTFNDIYPELRQRLRAKGLPAPSQRGTDSANQFPFTANATACSPTADTAPGQYSRSPRYTGAAQVPEVGGTHRHTLTGHTRFVQEVVFSPEGRLLASVDDGGRVRLWDPATGQKLRTLGSRTKPLRSVAFSPDGRLLAGVDDGGRVRLWDPATGQKLRTPDGHTGAVNVVAFSPDGRLLAGVDDDGTVWLWDPATREHRRTLDDHTESVYGGAFSPDGRLLAGVDDDDTVWLWDPATGEKLRYLDGHINPFSFGVLFSPDGRLLAGVDDDGRVRLWDPATGQKLRTLGSRTKPLRSVAFSPDGQLLASVGDGTHHLTGYRTVRLWDPATGEKLRYLDGHTAFVREVVFSPDGRLLAGGGDGDGTVWLWDPATGEKLRTLDGHTGAVNVVAFSPDGRLLASGGSDKTVRLWDLSARAIINSLHSGVSFRRAVLPGWCSSTMSWPELLVRRRRTRSWISGLSVRQPHNQRWSRKASSRSDGR